MLKGTLDDFTLPDVFRLMSFAKKTGRVDVVRSAGQGKVFFRDGEVYFAESSLSREPLGQKLVRSRVLTEGQLMKALDEQASSKKRLGTVLMDSGLVTEEQIESAIRQQIEDSIFDLLRWELGEFEWEPGAMLDAEVHIGVSVENLIMEASRRLDEYEVIKRKIPSGQAILGMAATPPEGAVEINITPQEWRILVLVDGSRTVENIAATVGLDEFGAMRVLYGLVSAGLIELISEGASESTQQVAAESVAQIMHDEPVQIVEEPVAQVVEEESVTISSPEPGPPVSFDELAAYEPESVVADEPAAQSLPEAEPATAYEMDSEPVVLSEAEPEFTQVDSEPASVDISADLIDSFGTFEGSEIQADVVAAAVDEPNADAADLASFGLDSFDEINNAPTAQTTDDAAWTDVTGIEAFDAPQPDELVTSTPEFDPFVSDLFSEPATTPVAEEPPPPPAAPEEPIIPVSSAPAGAEPLVDRAAAARELAGLFGDDDRPRARPSAPPRSEDASEDTRKRVEDDDQVTKGIISRLIDGVKGL